MKDIKGKREDCKDIVLFSSLQDTKQEVNKMQFSYHIYSTHCITGPPEVHVYALPPFHNHFIFHYLPTTSFITVN